MSSVNVGELLLNHIEQYFALRQYDQDPVFVKRLNVIREYQVQRLLSTHQHLMTDPQSAPALQFLIDEVYGDRDLRPVANDIRRATERAMALLPNSVMATCATVMEAALLTQQLDEAMVDLGGNALDTPLTPPEYDQLYGKLGRQADRIRQIELIAAVGPGIDKYIKHRLLQRTFKLVRKPAHAAGFSNLYDFLQQAFAALKPVPKVAPLLEQVAVDETRLMHQLLGQ